MLNQIFVILLFFLVSCSSPVVPQEPLEAKVDSLCNQNATFETQQLWQLLCDVYEKQSLSGVVANVDWNTVEADNVYKWTGRYPALNVFDFIHIHSSKDVNPDGWIDYSDITPVLDWHNAGGIVGCMWHWQMPRNDGKGYTCTPGDQEKQTSFDISKIDDTSSDEYAHVIRDIDQVASYLKKMQKRGIPVIWRPLHEAAGNIYEYKGGAAWFWWGAQGNDAYKKLWKLMYDRLVHYHRLNNLIWVWTSQVGDWDWYPGDDMVDVIGRDSYYALEYPLIKEYKQLKNQFPKKIIALSECGNGDEVDMSLWTDIWQQGSHWSWFMTWYDYQYNEGATDEHKYASETWWRNAFNSGVVLDRDAVRALLNK